MVASLASPPPAGFDPLAAAAPAANGPIGARPGSQQARLWAQAQDFETHFVNSMLQEMYTGIQGDGPFGNSQGVGPWRSFLTEEYAKNFVKAGGMGIAGQVYQSLLAHQEAHAKQGS